MVDERGESDLVSSCYGTMTDGMAAHVFVRPRARLHQHLRHHVAYQPVRGSGVCIARCVLSRTLDRRILVPVSAQCSSDVLSRPIVSFLPPRFVCPKGSVISMLLRLALK